MAPARRDGPDRVPAKLPRGALALMPEFEWAERPSCDFSCDLDCDNFSVLARSYNSAPDLGKPRTA
jgi:hypothetical protein